MQVQLRDGAFWRYTGALRKSTAAGAKGEKRYVGVEVERSTRGNDMVCRTARHRETERADARNVFLLERVDSCGSEKSRKKTKLNFGSSLLGDHRRSPTLGAESRILASLAVDIIAPHLAVTYAQRPARGRIRF
jgi:hypothetical protein